MNIFAGSVHAGPRELVDVLAESKDVRIERIVSNGQRSDWYDQAETEFVLVVDGAATLEFEDGTLQSLTKGDWLVIPPHQLHRVIYTSAKPPCVWLCVFY